MTTPIVSVNDGPRITVSDLVGNPLWVPTKIKELLQNAFISETLFRDAGDNNNGLVGYHEGHPTFLVGDVEEIAEFGEIPVSYGERGTPVVVRATKRGLGVRVSREMITDNNVGEVNRQITQLTNTFKRADSRVARSLLATLPSMPVAEPWDSEDGNPRLDIATAIHTVTTAAPSVGGSDDEGYGFQPDTLVMNPGLLPILLSNENFLKVYQGNIANESIAYTGRLPGQIFGLDIIGSMTWPDDEITILERGTIGFYSDTWPLEITGLYPEGNGPLGGPTQSYRCDATHRRAIALDQPKAGVRLTGLLDSGS